MGARTRRVGTVLLGLWLIGAAGCGGADEADDPTTDIVSQSDPSAGDGGDGGGAADGADDGDGANVGNAPADTGDDGADDEGAGDDGGGGGDPEPDEQVAGEPCRAPGYEADPPDGWFQFECRYLSPTPISVDPSSCDCQFPIDLAVARNETHDEAVERIRSRPDVWDIRSEETLFVDGRVATLLDTVVTSGGRTVDRRLVVVDLGNGTLFVAATDRADQAPADLAYGPVLAALDTLLDSIRLRPL